MKNMMRIALKRDLSRKFDRDGEEGRETVGMGYFSINI